VDGCVEHRAGDRVGERAERGCRAGGACSEADQRDRARFDAWVAAERVDERRQRVVGGRPVMAASGCGSARAHVGLGLSSWS
jgi:hypothetical protein